MPPPPIDGAKSGQLASSSQPEARFFDDLGLMIDPLFLRRLQLVVPTVTRPFSPERRLAVVPGGGRAEPRAAARIHDDLAGLARAAGSGDPQAIQTFLITVGPHLLRVTRRLLGSHHRDVEDVAQECAYAVIDALPSFRGDCSAVGFACRIAVLTAMSTRRRLRAAKRGQEPEGDAALANVACLRQSPEQSSASRASAELVRELLNTLPLEQAEALALHCVLGYTLAEMAETSGISPETWKSRLRLAKAAFKRRALADPRALELIAPWGTDSR